MDADLMQNVMKLWNEPNGRNAFAIYCAACLIGQLAHAFLLWLRRELPCIIDRFKDDGRATVLSLITNVSAIVGVAILIPFETIPLQAALMMGLSQGFSSDSAVNKSTREVWTPAQRAAVADKKDT